MTDAKTRTESLRAAMEELLDAHARNTLYSGAGHWERARAALAQSEAQPSVSAEPVAFIDPRQLAEGVAAPHCITKPEYRSWADAQAGVEYLPVYASPPPASAPYVPLSDDDLAEVVLQEQFLLVCDGMEEFKEIARAIEKLVVGRMGGKV